MLEMLLRGKSRAGLFEVLAAARADGGGAKPRPRRTLALAGLAVLLLGLGGLWLGLDSRGPVLGGAPAGQEQPVRTAPALQEQVPAGLSAADVTLLPAAGSGNQAGESGEARTGADGDAQEGSGAPVSRLTLLPPRDQGPSLRERVGEGRPPLLNVARPEGQPVALRVAAPETARLARQAVYEPEGR